MAAKVQINMLGGFHVFVDNVIVDDLIAKTKKGCHLLQYLILQHGNPVPCIDLYEVLWPNDESSNPESALKTLISRTRNILSSISEELGKCIGTRRGSYRFDVNLPIQIDVYEFEALAAKLQVAEELTEENCIAFHRLQSLYSGDLLAQSSDENWVVVRSVDMHSRYIEIIHRFLDLFKAEGNYEEVIRIARQALDVDAFDERLNLDLMDALVRTKRSNESLMQYKHASNIYYRFLGLRPPEGIREFYKQIVNKDVELEMDIDKIRSDLSDSESGKGAFVCEYSVFKDIYKLLERSLERLGLTIFLVLCRVSTADGQDIEPMIMDDVMKRLLDIMRGNLRRGDTISQFGASQYALLLTTVNYDTCKMIMERIRRAFYSEMANSNIMFCYRMGPIDGKTI
ncbi:MAG: BTAD domain-containing putative transcriptional regulator [Clostridia bacterium]|nr:BTAD domain-containing putative transcriptional regulator [Clostridia bacterium]